MSDAETVEATAAPPTVQRLPLPDFADILFLLIIMLLVNILPNYVLGDGSTGWHLWTGKYILEHGHIPQQDLFSYTFPDKAWVPYEWLFDAIAWGLVKVGGIKLVSVATSVALAGVFTLVYHGCRKQGCHFLLAMLLTVLGILCSTIHWLARPHIFTFFGVCIFAQTLESYRTGKCSAQRLIGTIAVTMLIWANAHPAFLIGFGLIGIYLVCETFIGLMAKDSEVRPPAFKRAGTLLVALLTAIGVSFINPNALHLYTYIFQYLGHSYVIQHTDEFMPPDFKKLHAQCLALLFFFFVVGLFLSQKKIGLSPLMMVLALAWLSLNSMRNEPLFAIAAVPLIASLYTYADLSPIFGKPNVQRAVWLEKIKKFWDGIGQTVDETESSCTMHLLPIITTAVLVIACIGSNNGKLLGMELITSDFDPATKPSTTLVSMMRLPEKGGFNLDNWGGYITYKTGRRVFIDDRLDFYGQDYFVDYGQIIGLNSGWDKLLEKHGVNWVLMPKKSSLVLALQASPDWHVEAEDKAAMLLVRKQPLTH